MPKRKTNRPLHATTAGSFPALLALYAALLAAKLIYAGFILLVPRIVAHFLGIYEEALGTALSDYRVSRIWLVAFLVLTVLTGLLAMQYTRQAAALLGGMESEAAARRASRKLVVSWILLDSICFYGIVAKALRYEDVWCYGFIVVSALLTGLAGWPLPQLRRTA